MKRAVKAVVVVVTGVALTIGSVTVIGATLPVSHVATRSQTFGMPRDRLWDEVIAEFGRTNDGSYAIVERQPTTLLVTRITNTNLPYGGSWSYHLRDAAAGSTLTIIEHGEVHNPFFRFVSRYVIGHSRTLDEFFSRLTAATSRQA